MDAEMEAVASTLYHYAQTQQPPPSHDPNRQESRTPPKKHHTRHHRTTRTTHRTRKKKQGSTIDGYENSGHETSDFLFTEDDKSDYIVTEDDNDDNENGVTGCEDEHDNNNDKGEVVGDDGLVEDLAKLSFGVSDPKPLDDADIVTSVNNENYGDQSSSDGKAIAKPQSQLSPPPHSSPPSNTNKSPRKRTRRPAKKKAAQAAQEDSPTIGTGALKEEEELTCNTPQRAPGHNQQQKQQQQTKQQQQQQQQQPYQRSPKQQTHKRETSTKQHENILTKVTHTICYEIDHPHDPYEDADDYPASMTPTNPTFAKTREENTEEDYAPAEPKVSSPPLPKRTLEEELSFLKRISPTKYQVNIGFVPNMKVPAEIFVNNDLQTLLVQELHDTCCGSREEADSAFIPALRQAANVAALPGIVKASLAMPDVHSGYGFCIGNVAAFDMDDPQAVISPGGVGFDINCGVRLIRTNLTEKDVEGSVREELAEALFRNIPVGVGVSGGIPCSIDDLDQLLRNGVDWAIEKGYAWEEDKDHCEENGCMETADPNCVSKRAKKRGLKQLGTLGAGNHYTEIQVVDEVYNTEAAKIMGIGTVGQVCIMIHTGSRGLGHQVATDALQVMEEAMCRDAIDLNDRQLSCARISSKEGREYLGE
eukprot:scaffold693_cov200-Alexandrium_tamarense.AAC.29